MAAWIDNKAEVDLVWQRPVFDEDGMNVVLDSVDEIIGEKIARWCRDHKALPTQIRFSLDVECKP